MIKIKVWKGTHGSTNECWVWANLPWNALSATVYWLVSPPVTRETRIWFPVAEKQGLFWGTVRCPSQPSWVEVTPLGGLGMCVCPSSMHSLGAGWASSATLCLITDSSCLSYLYLTILLRLIIIFWLTSFWLGFFCLAFFGPGQMPQPQKCKRAMHPIKSGQFFIFISNLVDTVVGRVLEIF